MTPKAAKIYPIPAQPRLFSEPEALKPTGTSGPRPAIAPRALKREEREDRRIPFNVAVREVVEFVTKELSASGEQWSDQSKQDMVSTALIAAQKQGLLSCWER